MPARNAAMNSMTEWLLNFCLLALLGIFAWKDKKSMEIPVWLVVCALAAGVVLQTAHYQLTGEGNVMEILLALFPGGLLLAGSLITRGKIGAGDGCVFLICGLFLGGQMVMRLFLLATLIASAAALWMLMTGRKSRGDLFPYIPCIFFGQILLLIFHLVSV